MQGKERRRVNKEVKDQDAVGTIEVYNCHEPLTLKEARTESLVLAQYTE